jgi:hypothetical protein
VDLVDLSGIIFVVLAFAWAVYLVPKAVRHQEDVARTRSVDRFSSAMRVLARNEPAEDRDALVPPTRPGDSAGPSGSAPDADGSVGKTADPPRPNLAARRAAARAAARRRRRVTLVLVLATLVVTGLAAFAVLPWWTVSVPVSLTVLFLFLCRRQVRRENDALWSARPASAVSATSRRAAARVDASYGSMQVDVQPVAHEGQSGDDTANVPAPDVEAAPVAVEAAADGSLWDPLPVTLPTYVNKARASRTVRTIDLGAPGSWTSGRDEADSALVEQSGACQSDEDATLHEARRAVGS